ncbi:MAG: CrcB protein [Cyclobacteriaceae bacterium]|jgi:CrcB protein
MKEVIFVGLGGFLGSISRYGVGLYAMKYFSGYFPVGTFIVNLTGSLLIGLLAGYFFKNQPSQILYLFLVTGFCGGYTTFSTFSLDNLRLLKEELYMQFAIYGFGSLIAGLLLCALGFWITYKYLS